MLAQRRSKYRASLISYAIKYFCTTQGTPHSHNFLFYILPLSFIEKQKKQANFWKNEENRRSYMELLGTKCGFAALEDWYQVKASHFRTNEGKYELNQLCLVMSVHINLVLLQV
jgi:hypothetical protein